MSLFNIGPAEDINSFKLTITAAECLRLPSTIELYLAAFDTSIVSEVHQKEIDQLDQRKLNMVRIIRKTRRIARDELYNFNSNSKFKFAIVFIDQTGVVDIAMQDEERTCT